MSRTAEKREILIRTGQVAIRARLLATPTADRIWRALPIYANAHTYGDEVYFAVGAWDAPREQIPCEPGARDVVAAGELAYWPDRDCIAIGFGPTPASRHGEIRFDAPHNIWATALDDVTLLRGVYDGDLVAVIPADS